MDKKEILKETREIDNWKCPYCHEIIYDTPKAMEDSAFDIMDTFHEQCPHCGKTSKIFISPQYIAHPLKENITDEEF
ncbi:hypothetical protein FDC62_11310 [Clostridium botulinum]|uniref:hypothetical protein n=1 Tax=Clostridium botulinum TaxID=1491 RepID=UPI000991E0E6|nr:hypothetical protein [Clostridium botulinum]NFO98771.1 hypothetical protein [Clostridium botulinum]OOV52313.1 hypothetical protein B1A66_04700 [Clostridium botulinum D/C]OOV54081.1 hypothetical protein B0673_11505 [Clostridium botulinum D/C]OOV58081.1 hypothetical protein B1A67_03540 [Clostridium botulinum D/C]